MNLITSNYKYSQQCTNSVHALASLAREEDLPDVDLTANLLSAEQKNSHAHIITRVPIVMSGVLWIPEMIKAYFANSRFEQSGKLPQVEFMVQDGDVITTGDVPKTLIKLSGNNAMLLALERILLNFLGRTCGIATATYAFVEIVRKAQGNKATTKILDTRKTLPGFRYLDKYAAFCGGGVNHRMHLSDQLLLKENHIFELGGVKRAINLAKIAVGNKDFICEVRSIEEAQTAITMNCPIIMLDNFTPQMVKIVCELPRKKSKIEVSGGINLNNINEYLHPNLDRISIGSITHSVNAPDLTMLMEGVL